MPSGIGPQLPPHLLSKRKRERSEELEVASATASGAKTPPEPDEPEKRRKIAGPAMPPAPLDERPANESPEESSEDEDDDFGPAMPTGVAGSFPNKDITERIEASATAAESKPKRDEWMTMAPKQDDLAARLDPTKQRPKGFNTGKGARAPNNLKDDSSTWHETPEQKRKRLEDEMMGRAKPAASGKTGSSKSSRGTARDEATRRRIQEHESTRGSSLMEQHRASKGQEAEDDPSKRAFDREKDIANGTRASSTQKREMLNKAAGFTSKFSGGSFL